MFEIKICPTCATDRLLLGAGPGSAGGAWRWGSSCGPGEVALSLGEIDQSREEDFLHLGQLSFKIEVKTVQNVREDYVHYLIVI
jgi:hypothetical protein